MGQDIAVQAPHCAEAEQYAREVVEGRQVACHWVVRACQRQLDDLEAWRSGEREGWEFRYEEAERVCDFIELLPHIKGRWAKPTREHPKGRTIDLEPWQKFILTTVFGWYVFDEEAQSWVRRFRTVYKSIGRKNAKSTIANGAALFCGFAEEEHGAEVYSAAAGRDQASYTFEIGLSMVKKAEGFRNRFGVQTFAHNVHALSTGSRYMAISAEARQLDGKNPHFALVDEFHAHPTPAVRDSLKTGMGARENPLEWIVTTAGNNLGGPCYAFESYAKKVLDGILVDDSLFAIIFTLDGVDLMAEGEEGDRWDDPKVWVKANPNLGVSVFARDLKARCEEAKADPVQQTAFKTKRLNMWVSADQRWMNMQEWAACSEPFNIEDMKGTPAMVGLDLATKDDIAARMLVWARPDGHVYVKGKFFLPADLVREKAASTTAHYAGWAAEGRLTLTPGNVTDLESIQAEVLALPDLGVQVQEVCYDPWQATQLAQGLQSEGMTVVEVRPTVANFSEPMKDLAALVKSRKFHHGGCPVLTWMVSNIVAHIDQKDNIYPRKERPEAKIGGIVAILMARRRQLVYEAPVESQYNRGAQLSTRTG